MVRVEDIVIANTTLLYKYKIRPISITRNDETLIKFRAYKSPKNIMLWKRHDDVNMQYSLVILKWVWSGSLACSSAVLFTSVDKRYISAFLSFWCYLVYKMLIPDAGLEWELQYCTLRVDDLTVAHISFNRIRSVTPVKLHLPPSSQQLTPVILHILYS